MSEEKQNETKNILPSKCVFFGLFFIKILSAEQICCRFFGVFEKKSLFVCPRRSRRKEKNLEAQKRGKKQLSSFHTRTAAQQITTTTTTTTTTTRERETETETDRDREISCVRCREEEEEENETKAQRMVGKIE